MIQPSGHKNIEGSSKSISSEHSDIEKELLEMIESNVFLSQEVLEAHLKNLIYSPIEVQKALIRNRDNISHNQLMSFLNGAYNSCSSRYIRHQVPFGNLDCIGLHMPKDKVMYVSGSTGGRLGAGSSGVIVNKGETGDDAGMGISSSGILIQAGPSGEGLGVMCSGLTIALVEPKSYDPLRGNFLRCDEVSQDLRSYCNRLIEICVLGERKVHEELGEYPADRIRQDIYRMIDWNLESGSYRMIGHEVKG